MQKYPEDISLHTTQITEKLSKILITKIAHKQGKKKYPLGFSPPFNRNDKKKAAHIAQKQEMEKYPEEISQHTARI